MAKWSVLPLYGGIVLGRETSEDRSAGVEDAPYLLCQCGQSRMLQLSSDAETRGSHFAGLCEEVRVSGEGLVLPEQTFSCPGCPEERVWRGGSSSWCSEGRACS